MTDPNASIYVWGADSFKANLGLTKREYFAAMAMQGYLAAGNLDHSKPWIAEAALQSADSLIAELNKEVKPNG